MRKRTWSALRVPCSGAPDEPPVAVCPGRYDGGVADADGRTACRTWPTGAADRCPRTGFEPTREATRYFPEGEHGFETVAGGNNRATVPT